MTDPTCRFSSKAEKYARYRWDYAPGAIQAVFERVGLNSTSTVADVGSGTGILTRHFVDKVRRVYAIEPNPEMRAWSDKTLRHYSAYRSLAGQAEATTLPDHSVDLVTAATALHWFQPEEARREFIRILKPGGWLAILWNHQVSNKELQSAIESFSTKEYGWETKPWNARLPRDYEHYFLQEESFFKANYPQV